MAFRRLLMITYHFPPSSAVGGHRLLGFSRHLPSFGWCCSVVAPPGLPWEPNDPELTKRVSAQTTLYHAPYPTGLIWKPLRKVLPLGCWLPWARSACQRAIRECRPDALLTSGPPHVVHLLGLWMRRRYGLPWVADFRDPWASGDLSTMTRKIGSWEPRYEATVVREAAAIVANTPRARDQLATAYPQHAAKIVAITNGYDPELFEVNPVPPLTGDAVEIVHPGQIYANRDPAPFLESLRILATEDAAGGRPIRVKFIGCEGDRAELVKRLAREAGVGQAVTVIGNVPHAESIRAMCQADILLLVDTPGRRSGVPAKLFEYLGAGRPILAMAEPDGDVAWVLQHSRSSHQVASPCDTGEILRALSELTSAFDPSVAQNRDPWPRIAFTRNAVTEQLAELLDKVATSTQQVG